MCTEEDLCVLPELQQRIINMLTDEAGVDVDVHMIPSGQCPNVGVPKTLVQLFRRLSGEVI